MHYTGPHECEKTRAESKTREGRGRTHEHASQQALINSEVVFIIKSREPQDLTILGTHHVIPRVHYIVTVGDERIGTVCFVRSSEAGRGRPCKTSGPSIFMYEVIIAST